MAKNPVVIVLSTLAVVACVAAVTLGVVCYRKTTGEGGDQISASTKAIRSICEPTRYKEACVNSLSAEAGNTTDPKELIRAAFKVAKDQISKGLEKSKTLQDAKKDTATAQALEICEQVMGYAMNDLERTMDSTAEFKLDNINAFMEDLKIWIGGAITYQEVCFDAFDNTTTDAGQKLRGFFNLSRELTSNALTIVSDLKQINQLLDIRGLDAANLQGGPAHRRLLGKKGGWVAGVPPAWANSPKRKVMNVPVGQIKPDAVVAQDGSGQYKTLGEALAKVPKKSLEPFIIYIKAGTYKEYNVIPKDTWNVILVGDGPDKTVISGDKSAKNGVKTFFTAPLGVDGEGFMARDIKFENTAGPEGHQAVALRVASDFAIFHNCKFVGAQDTLYSMRGRQFYRDCTITGTIDFIFGDAQAVYQKCEIVITKPMQGQDCEVTAHSRSEPNGPGGFVIQGSRITADNAYKTFQNQPGKSSYLGRPWKEYARTVIMNSYIDESINPEGWHPWPAAPNSINTAYYAEYQNQGPGADTSKRVKWPAVKQLSPQDAESFTPAKLFVNPDQWIATTGVPFAAGAFSG